MKNANNTIIVALVVIILVCFFFPWLKVESAAVGGITKVITGKHQSLVDGISGFRIPILANSSESKFMTGIIRLFYPQLKHADKKSFFVWVIPGLAVLIFLGFNSFSRKKWFNFLTGVIGCAVFFAGTYKIGITDLDKFVLQIRIGWALWVSLFAYLGIGIFSFLNCFRK